MNRRKGFLLLWVQMASAMLLLLLGGVLALMASAERSAFHAEETADMTLLAEEAMELMKSDPSAGLLPVIPTEEERNGRRYTVETRREITDTAGISCTTAVVTVRSDSGTALSFRTLTGPAPAEEGGRP